VRRAAESAQADLVISRVSLQEGRRQSVRARELHVGVLIDLRQPGLFGRHIAYAITISIREPRRVLRGRVKEFAIRTVVEVEQLLLVARERADITHAQYRVPADVVLDLETETLSAGDVSFRIGVDHAVAARPLLPPGVLAARGDVAD